MKELNIKEKAHRYDEAIKVANKYKDTHIMFSQIKDEIFPELAESDDEKIRKSIIAILKNYVDDSNTFKSKMIAWLEKQGEQKSTNKIEPKFHEGDWVAYNHNINLPPKKIIQITNKHYVFADCSFETKTLETDWHLWTIQDAKDGDVLAVERDEAPFIFKGFDRFHPGWPVAYCGIDDGGTFIVNLGDGWWTDEEVYPATKEQYDFLFRKMHDAGYEWDAEKRELKKIEQKSVITIPKFKVGDKVYELRNRFECTIESIDETTYYGDTTNFDIKDQDNWELVEQNPAWSEEDGRIYKSITYSFAHNYPLTIQQQEFVKFLKDKVQKPKQEWSALDETNIQGIIDEIEATKKKAPGYDIATYNRFLNWLKYLKDRVQPQKQEWSGVDKDILFRIIDDLKFLRDDISKDTKYAVNIVDVERKIAWLKSLKPRTDGSRVMSR